MPSGYAFQLALALAPLDALVGSVRLAREHKYRLLLRFVLPARLAWAPHTPTDRAVVLDEVVTAYRAGVIPLETAVQMLRDAGYPINDAFQDVARIRVAVQSVTSPGLMGLLTATADRCYVRHTGAIEVGEIGWAG
ncbi:hypothetical protein AB0L75_25290 [Streptomyces sp. NPDC052101]|uniref:hypothetical protein n=1 Tax=Streptomyces sp. NPDC052101 TaxID=3155763 RepID=UPI003434B12F